MVRSRLLNPELFKDEDLAALPAAATLLFEGLWCLAEDSGCLEDRPRVIRAELFGLRDDVTLADVEGWLEALVSYGKIRRYEADSRRYLWITKFLRHQRFKYIPKDGHPLPPELAAKIQERFGKAEESGEQAASYIVPPESSGSLRTNPEKSGMFPSRAPARREEKGSKEKGREGGAATPREPSPLLPDCLAAFAAAAGRPIRDDEQRTVTDWLSGGMKYPPPRDVYAFEWAIGRAAPQAKPDRPNIVPYAASIAADAPEQPRVPPLMPTVDEYVAQLRRNGPAKPLRNPLTGELLP